MRSLARLLRPKSLAVVGGGTWGANVIRASEAMGFDGPIWPVHPAKDTVAGRKAYPNVDALPDAPDAAFVGVNRYATLDILSQLRNKGAGGATCFASGFAEATAELADGADLQTQLLDAAGDMPILGPNCYGMLNYLDKVAIWPDQHGSTPVQSGVALIAQSSNIAINLTMHTRGLPLAYVITAGNQAQTDLAEIAMETLRDPRVTALGLHIEGINDINSLQDLSKLAHELEKPVAVLKIGASEEARAATLSHTASLAGSSAGASALLARLGFAEVKTLPTLLELLKIWHVAGPLQTARIASASCSGGEACLVADTAKHYGVTCPPLVPAQKTALRAALGPKVALSNPLDYHTYIWPDTNAMQATFTGLMQGDADIGFVILDFPRSDRCDASEWDNVVEAVLRTRAETGKPMAIVSALPETLPEPVAARLIAGGVVPLNGLDHAIDATAQSVLPLKHPDPVLLPSVPSGTRTLSEHQAKQALNTHGLRRPRAKEAGTPEEAARASADLTPPLALKGTGFAHKSEAGALALNLHTQDAVQAAAEDMNCDGYLIEEMVENAIFEMLLGVTLDPAHGYVLTCGAGGTRTELLQDTISLLLPVTKGDVEAALARLRLAPVLRGYRGAPGCNMDAIWAAIAAVQSYVLAEHGKVREVEINPLICTAEDAVAVDALIILGDPT